MRSLDSLRLSQWCSSSHCVSDPIYFYLFRFRICLAVQPHYSTLLRISVCIIIIISSGLLPVLLLLVLSRVWSVTTEVFWIDDRIYWTLRYGTLTTLYSTLLRTHTLVPIAMPSLPLLGSGSQQRMFPFLWDPKLSLASATSFLQPRLTTSEPQLLPNSLTDSRTNSLQLLTCPVYNISAWTTQKTPLLCSCLQAAAQQRLLYSCLFRSHC
jgi:hypothetical protein